MSFGERLLMGLAALLAVAGMASAQCVECDPDGEPGTGGSYGSADAGAVTDHGGGVADTDLSFADSGDEEGFWAWLSLCLTAFLASLEQALGIDSGVDASADAYVGEHGVDLDARAALDGPACEAAARVPANVTDEPCAFDFDRSEAGGVDGATWDLMADAHETAGDGRFVDGMPADAPAFDGFDADACASEDLHVSSCG